MDNGEFKGGNTAGALEFLKRFDSVFDVLDPSRTVVQYSSGPLNVKIDIRTLAPDSMIDSLIAERAAAKKAHDFARADQIRSNLASKGVIVEDTRDGPRWKRQ
jgi:cysteinyl-tRNA synthetase